MPYTKTYCWEVIINTAWYRHKNRLARQWHKLDTLETHPCIYRQMKQNHWIRQSFQQMVLENWISTCPSLKWIKIQSEGLNPSDQRKIEGNVAWCCLMQRFLRKDPWSTSNDRNGPMESFKLRCFGVVKEQSEERTNRKKKFFQNTYLMKDYYQEYIMSSRNWTTK